MNSKLTPEEIRLASRYANRYEKTAKIWVWFRWFFLLMGILMVGVSYHLFTLANTVHDKNTSAYILKGRNLDTSIVKEYIDARIELSRRESALNIRMIFPTVFGSALLGFAIGGWKLHENYKLIAKGLRTLIALSPPDEETSNHSLRGPRHEPTS